MFDKINTSPLEEPILEEEQPLDVEVDDTKPVEALEETEPVEPNEGSSDEDTVDEEDSGIDPNIENIILRASKEYKVPEAQDGEAVADGVKDMLGEVDEDDPAIQFITELIERKVNERTADIRTQQENDVLDRKITAVAQKYPTLQDDGEVGKLAQIAYDIASELGQPELARNPSERLLMLAAEEMYGGSKSAMYEKGKRDGQGGGDKDNAKAALNPKPGTSQSLKADSKVRPEDQLADMIVNSGRKNGLFRSK